MQDEQQLSVVLPLHVPQSMSAYSLEPGAWQYEPSPTHVSALLVTLPMQVVPLPAATLHAKIRQSPLVGLRICPVAPLYTQSFFPPA
jgi:hypothetical protein